MPRKKQNRDPSQKFDAIVIGTGFAGAVTACRLVQAGLRICVLERGRRYEVDDFPVYPRAFAEQVEEGDVGLQPDLTRLLWSTGGGVWDLRNLGDVFVAQAAGFGGGSLIYANVHLRAPREVFRKGWPAQYQQLDDYYDLAAYMLDVKPIPGELPKKTEQLREAAERTRHENAEILSFFLPPLAVNFPARQAAGGGKVTNRFGRQQGTCDLRGECIFGCRSKARNTLDLNYLAVVEDARDRHGQPLADIRTQAEVVSIKTLAAGQASGRRDAASGYAVEYVDRCFERSVRDRAVEVVTASYVFLCAGAVNSTELLLRARRNTHLNPKSPALGHRYHSNADALSVVFDCERLQEVDRGPTIGGALLHRSKTAWLLIQDGGFPEPIEPLLGLFRSPLWAGRNRFRESTRDREQRERGEPMPQPLPYAPLPFGGARGLLAELERASVTPRFSLSHALSAQLYELQSLGRPGDQARRWRVLPDQMEKALVSGYRDLLGNLAVAAEPLVETFLDSTADKIKGYELLKGLLERLPIPDVDPDGLEDLELERQMLRLAVQRLWGSQAGLVHEIVTLLLKRLLPDRDSLLRQISDLLRWSLDHRLSNGHTAVLLSMGRDASPGKLRLESSGRLSASLPARLESSETLLQERLLRDIARKAWQGELRMNPTWAFLDRRITVHSQGGCPMGTDPSRAVTRPDGEVYGCPGLYVMDGAAFPTPVGVNPSATIAAVAEYKIETFLRAHTGDEHWKAADFADAQRWARDHTGRRRPELDPLETAPLPASHAPPESKPIGIFFKEVMKGCHGAAPAGGGHQRGVLDYRDCELAGIAANASVETVLEAEIEDLARFLEEHRRYEQQFEAPQCNPLTAPRIPLKGAITLSGLPGRSGRKETFAIDVAKSFLVIHSRGPHGGRQSPGERKIEYELDFEIERTPWRLEGLKFLRDDPKLDVWEDSTTLCFTLLEHGTEVRRGILRLPANEFFGVQLPSFEATHTDDPVRHAWALTAFGQLFFGRLVNVYVPELADVARAVAKMAGSTHV